jgi:predicted nucleic acid-binding protein
MTFLVDANVLSEPTKAAPDRKVVEWLRANERNLVIDSIVLAELEIGVLTLPAGRKRTQLRQWLESVAETIECIPWDAPVARRWAAVVAELKRTGKPMPIMDGMIAATALHHGLTLATRNQGDFASAGVKTVNPFE